MTDETTSALPVEPAPAGNAVTRVARTGIDTARNAALEAAEKTAQAIEGNPVAVLVGGLTVGLIAGALLPRAKTEAEV
ncbi:hypothetical protein, partial [Enterococcus faecalis]|uniref:hypothetical protein n=2 Tax=Bacteria TaxID=2 RepID=UPI00403F6408